MAAKYPISPAGKKKLEEELLLLKESRQGEISQEVKNLRSFCNFADNVSFMETLEQRAFIKERINKIENVLSNSEVIEAADHETTVIGFGSTVTFIELPEGERKTYTILGSVETDPSKNIISIESPSGKSLFGGKVGDTLSIDTPSRKIDIHIIEIR
ncbi:GreA/GreB family elongation factor [Carnobacteriaceae bacterium 52-44]